MTTYAFTGHRPAKLGGYKEDVSRALYRLIRGYLESVPPPYAIISGMALGVDQEAAFAAIQLGIPVIAAIPFAGQEAIWPEHSRDRYQRILKKCKEIVIVSPGAFSGEKMYARNRWMVDHCDELVALWDGTPGGTHHCVNYARSARVPITNLWDQWVKVKP